MDCSPSIFYTARARWYLQYTRWSASLRTLDRMLLCGGSGDYTSGAHRVQRGTTQAGRVWTVGVYAIYVGMISNDSGLDAVGDA